MSDGKGVALITGASSDIGAAYAQRLAARGKQTLVDCALRSLAAGELVCIPVLHELDPWQNYLQACQRVTDATQTSRAAARYGVESR